MVHDHTHNKKSLRLLFSKWLNFQGSLMGYSEHVQGNPEACKFKPIQIVYLHVFESKVKMSIQSSAILTLRPPTSSGFASDGIKVVISTPLTNTSDC